MLFNMSCVIKEPSFCICENEGADQLHGYHAAVQHLYFHYTDNTTPLLPKSEISSILPSSVTCVVPGWKLRRQVFS